MKTITVGRDSSNDIVVDNKIVSRHHAHFTINSQGQVVIKDLGSPNGTYVNDVKTTGCVLAPGDVVKLGNVVFDWQLNLKLFNQQLNSNPGSSEKISEQGNPLPNSLHISSFIAAELPVLVRNELATLPEQWQHEFTEEYTRNKKSLGFAYLFLIIVFWAHYGYLKKWGLQVLFWITAGGAGIWWLIDIFRLPGLVKNYNTELAIHVMRNLKVANRPVQNKTMMGD
jgi:pSer/pThr/pTyr-binding forkhead associated (FHA) protein